MIIIIDSRATNQERADLLTLLSQVTDNPSLRTPIQIDGREAIALENSTLSSSALDAIQRAPAVKQLIPIKSAYKLVSRAFKSTSSQIVIGSGHVCEQVTIGGPGALPVVMAGPCAVENREQLLATARGVKAAGGTILRGGAYKPRTSPYQFQGLGLEGLEILAEARDLTGLPVVTEVMEPELVETVAEYADILQIGSRNMQNFPLLLAAGRNAPGRPVLLKRGLAATIDEWLLAAEYIVSAGNPNVILCERGVRSFDPQTRNVLDLTCVPLLHELTHLPIIVDPSHGTGKRELVPTMARAGIAAGAEGLILEVHLDPSNAMCDGRQSITPQELRQVVREADLLGRMLASEAELVRVA